MIETTATPLLHVEGVSKRYSPADPWVLHGVAMTVNAGESLAILGPSGSGKSTLLNLLAALDVPTEGCVRMAGENLDSMSEKDRARLRARTIGLVFQLHHLLPQCTAWENVLLPTLPGGTTSESNDRAANLLDRVGLGDKHHALPGELSGGERQRLAVARALINQPEMLLADEPTGSLDHATAGVIADLLVEINREPGCALIVVTHSLELAKRMGYVLELVDGTLKPPERAL